MRSRWMPISGIVMMMVLVSLVLTSCRGKTTEQTTDFILPGLNGLSVTLSSLKGKVVLLDFWATWCSPCRASLPHTQRLSQSKEAKSGDLVVLAINQGEAAGTVQSYMRNNGYTFDVLLDRSGAVLDNYNSNGIPTFVVIGRDGKVAWKRTGYDEQGLNTAVQSALAQ